MRLFRSEARGDRAVGLVRLLSRLRLGLALVRSTHVGNTNGASVSRPAAKLVTDWRTVHAVKLGTFIVPGQPLAWARPNFVRKGPAAGRVLTDKEQREYSEMVQLIAKAAGLRVVTGPIGIRLRFFLTHRPDAHKRADWDNLSKLICDALNGIAYEDDGQIVHAEPQKYQDANNPRTEVTVAEFFP